MRATIIYKTGVQGVAQQPIEAALSICAVVYGWFGADTLTVTSIRDGKHMPGSLHSRGYAADLRTRTIPLQHRHALATAILGQLGNAYDVVLESEPPHIHIEFDPEHNGGKNLPD